MLTEREAEIDVKRWSLLPSAALVSAVVMGSLAARVVATTLSRPRRSRPLLVNRSRVAKLAMLQARVALSLK
ncbi:hypothetical protein FE156_20615 [Streptomyces albidoflavus]|nr:hypothetical protein FE156_20615 [Streptomyces albidoflavus]